MPLWRFRLSGWGTISRLPNQFMLSGLFCLSRDTRKPVFGVCDQVRHKPACAAIEAWYRLEISDIETGGIILSRQWKTKALRRLICAFVFRIWQSRFSHDVAQFCLKRRRIKFISNSNGVWLISKCIILYRKSASAASNTVPQFCQVPFWICD